MEEDEPIPYDLSRDIVRLLKRHEKVKVSDVCSESKLIEDC